MVFFGVFFLFFFFAPRVLIFDNAQGFLTFAASLCGVPLDDSRWLRGRVPLGGLFSSALCALAFGHPVGLVAGRVVLAEAWSGVLAEILGLAPLRHRKASLELLGLWGALSVWGFRYSLAEAVAVSALAVALPAIHASGCRALRVLDAAPRASSSRGPNGMNTVPHAIQAVAWVATVDAVRLVLAGALGVCAALHGALAVSVVLRRPRRRRLPSRNYRVRVRTCEFRRSSKRRLANAKKMDPPPPPFGGRAGLYGCVSRAFARGGPVKNFLWPPHGGARAPGATLHGKARGEALITRLPRLLRGGAQASAKLAHGFTPGGKPENTFL